MGDASSTPFQVQFGSMSDSQLSQTISQLSNAASQYTTPGYAAPAPQRSLTTYQKNIHNWSTSSTPPPRASSRRAKPARSSNLAPPRTATPTTHHHAPAPAAYHPPVPYPDPRHNPPPAPLPTTPQALHSTYASRLRTGATLLMQPLLVHPPAHAHAAPAAAAAAAAAATPTGRARRGAVVSYAEPASGDDDDDIPDAGEIDSDGSDFVASGGTRTAVRAARPPPRGTPARPPTSGGVGELDQSYLGMVPPARYIVPKAVAPTRHETYSQEAQEAQAARPTALVPIRVEFETETHRVRDCFVWNVNEALVSPEQFARTFCADLELPAVPWAEMVAAQIRAQLEDAEAVGAMDLAVDGARAGADEVPECRVILSIDVQVDNHHLTDHIEWDLRSPLTPEAFTHQLCLDLGLAGEAAPLIAHAVHEELLKHKKDAIEWGVVGGPEHAADDAAAARDKSGLSLLKDKTGLGLGWGRAPKDGRGPRVLRGVWRDWQEAEEFGTRWEVLTAEEVERREGERERASRRLRRETSKFQSSARTRRR